MTLTSLDFSILFPAFLAGILVLATHVPLGQQVLTRGIVFIDLAIAQVAGLGVTIADSIGWEPQGWRVQVAACVAALLGALLLTATEKRWPAMQEALIGVLFVAAACVELLLLANNPHGGEHLKDLLVGQILWVSPASLIPVAVLYAIVLALWFGFRERLGQIGFYVLFARDGDAIGSARRHLSRIRELDRPRPCRAHDRGAAPSYGRLCDSASPDMSSGLRPRRCSTYPLGRWSYVRSSQYLPYLLCCGRRSVRHLSNELIDPLSLHRKAG